MSDKTVEVPVDVLNRLAEVLEKNDLVNSAADVRSFIPKPKPRIVAVNLNDIGGRVDIDEYLSEQPDLLDVLDGVANSEIADRALRNEVKAQIRKALGVSDET